MIWRRHPLVVSASILGWVLLVWVWLPALAGLLPLRVIWGEAVIVPTGGCVQRVSERGIVHGPDSPHWAQTGTTRGLDQE